MRTIRDRADFVAAQSAARVGARVFLLQARDRADEHDPRFGFTVTKKVGNAPERNRIRRRLRAAVRQTAPLAARPGVDYVLIARREVLNVTYADLVGDLETALKRAGTKVARTTMNDRASARAPTAGP